MTLRVTVDTSGILRHKRDLDRKLGRALDEVAADIAGNARGRFGGRGRKRKRGGYIASRPGQPPNISSGDLKRSIHVTGRGPEERRIVATAPYAGFVALNMDRRFLLPAFQTIAPNIERVLAKRIKF